jgi:hypothetical protein
MQVGSLPTMPDGYLAQVDDASSGHPVPHHTFRLVAVPLECLVEQAKAVHLPMTERACSLRDLVGFLLSHPQSEGPLAWPNTARTAEGVVSRIGDDMDLPNTPQKGPSQHLARGREPFLRRELVGIEKGDQVAARLRDTRFLAAFWFLGDWDTSRIGSRWPAAASASTTRGFRPSIHRRPTTISYRSAG